MNVIVSIWPFRRKAVESEPASAKTGKWGEEQAELFLRAAGFKILGRRVRIGTRDELDLVARDGDVLVFVEVKTRKTELFGSPLTSVDREKRRVLSRAAVRYIRKLKDPRIAFRFDVVEVVGSPGEGNPVIRHVGNAFTLDRRYTLPA